MKKITHLAFIVTSFFVLILISCKKDNTEKIPPVITVSFSNGVALSDTSAEAGQTIIINIDAVAGSENITYFSMISNGEHVLDSGLNAESFTSQRIIVKSIDSVEQYTILVRDKNFLQTSVSFNLALLPTLNFGEIRTMNIELGAQDNGVVGGFYNLFGDQVLALSQAFSNQDSVQLFYYYDPLDENTIASPNANIDTSIVGGMYAFSNWTTRNEVRYVKLSVSQQDFINCINDSLIIANLFQYEVGKRKAKNLVAGDIYEFSHEGRYGIFYVNNVMGTTAGTINLTIKIQK